MTLLEFEETMKVVTSRWSEKAYPHAVVQRIWFFTKDLPVKSFEKIVFTLLDVQRAAPMPSEFRSLAYGEYDRLGLRNKTKEPESNSSKEAHCQDCADSGNLFAIHREKKTSVTFRCHCKMGANRPFAQGEQWSTRWEKVYEKDSIYLGIKGNWAPRENCSLVFMAQQMANMHAETSRNGKLESAGEKISKLTKNVEEEK